MFINEIRDRLVAQGVGVFGTSIFKGSLAIIPDGPGPYLSLIETGGSGSARTHNDTATQRPTMQLVARASTYPAAYAMWLAAYNALGGANGLYNITLSGVFYLSITARQSAPTDIGVDEKERIMLDFNIDAEKAPS